MERESGLSGSLRRQRELDELKRKSALMAKRDAILAAIGVRTLDGLVTALLNEPSATARAQLNEIIEIAAEEFSQPTDSKNPPRLRAFSCISAAAILYDMEADEEDRLSEEFKDAIAKLLLLQVSRNADKSTRELVRLTHLRKRVNRKERSHA